MLDLSENLGAAGRLKSTSVPIFFQTQKIERLEIHGNLFARIKLCGMSISDEEPYRKPHVEAASIDFREQKGNEDYNLCAFTSPSQAYYWNP